jgi:hypothetical protein
VKFIYTAGQYIQKMGRMFAFGQPVEVTDKATIMALEQNPDFKKVTDEKIQDTPQAVLADECPKCGKIVKRGKFMHQKHCKGSK